MHVHASRRLQAASQRLRKHVKVATVALALALGCQRSPAPPQVRLSESPAPAASGEPNLSSAGNRLYLSWLLQLDPGHTMQYAMLHDGHWSEARTVASGDSFIANWADFPSLAELSDGSLVAQWLWRSGPDTYAYDVALARSADGMQWGRRMVPHRDATATEHGFASLVPDAQGGATLVWLDGRDYADKEQGEMILMSATLNPDGCSPERALDARVCDCCQTAAVRTANGLLVAYRDRSPEEVRDISLVRFANGIWSAPYPLAQDGWEIAGCPVNGPALAAAGTRVAAAWFTMAGERAAVHVALSQDEGATFPVRARVDDGDPIGRVDVILLPRSGALVLWVEADANGEASIRARRVRTDGSLDASFAVSGTTSERASGFPRMERLDSTVYFAWTEPGAPSRVRMATLDLPARW